MPTFATVPRANRIEGEQAPQQRQTAQAAVPIGGEIVQEEIRCHRCNRSRGLRQIEDRAGDGERKPEDRHMDEQADPADQGKEGKTNRDDVAYQLSAISITYSQATRVSSSLSPCCRSRNS